MYEANHDMIQCAQSGVLSSQTDSIPDESKIKEGLEASYLVG